ncbi:DMT family transporter [Fimbriimonas ginsengisoli]|uniref:DMT family transporter n=1 Tax=Fimbriimonas ginsengisoli TaxID=1005039 RepID=UPI00130E5554|nr:DMT family transporter [Fimbriimonas ginsengisoli]
MRRPVSFSLPLAVASLSWGFNFVAIKVLEPEMGEKALGLLRFLVMWGLLVVVCRVRGESLRYRKEDKWQVLLVGAVSMGIYMILFLEGLARTGAAEGAIILATSPIMTYLLSCRVGQEKFQPTSLTGTLVAFLGVTMVVLGGASSERGTVFGEVLVIASSITWAISAVMMRPLLSRYEPTQVLTMSMPGALPILLIYATPAVLSTKFGAISTLGWAMFAHIAILSGVVAFACFYAGLRQVGAGGATLYQYFVPPLAVLFSLLILHKTLGAWQLLGLAVVLTGVILASNARRAALAADLADAAR